MNPGALDRQITLQAKVATRDSFGGAAERWIDRGDVWAQRLDQGGGEFRRAGVVNSEVTTIFRLRYNPNLTPAMRILHEGALFDIVSINEGEGRRMWTIVQAKARAA
jgi:SPP1 family predicted phage head-tail adaptor